MPVNYPAIRRGLDHIHHRFQTLPPASRESRILRWRAYLFAALSVHENLERHEAAYRALWMVRLETWQSPAVAEMLLKEAGLGLYRQKGRWISESARRLLAGEHDDVPTDDLEGREVLRYFHRWKGLGPAKAAFAGMLVGVRGLACFDTHMIARYGLDKRALDRLPGYMEALDGFRKEQGACADLTLASWRLWNETRAVRGRTGWQDPTDHRDYFASQEAPLGALVVA